MSSDTGLTAAVEYHVVNSLGWPALRPLQRAAVEPARSGADCLLIAPTAGGKTEAVMFPLLSQMAEEDLHGLSVNYVTPLRALLNNLQPRLPPRRLPRLALRPDRRAAYRCADLTAGRAMAERILSIFHTCPVPEIARLGRSLRR
ncbi:DEAD/DEAH box helicase [Georgenia sp. MJ173]